MHILSHGNSPKVIPKDEAIMHGEQACAGTRGDMVIVGLATNPAHATSSSRSHSPQRAEVHVVRLAANDAHARPDSPKR